MDSKDKLIMELHEELIGKEQRINNVKEYIRLNFCNRKDINDCWHSGMQDILDLLNGKEIEGD